MKKFSFNPKYAEQLNTNYSDSVLVGMVHKTIQRISWYWVTNYYILPIVIRVSDKKNAEQITIHISNGQINIESHSVGLTFFDKGRNALNVSHFKNAFQQVEQEKESVEKIAETEKKHRKQLKLNHSLNKSQSVPNTESEILDFFMSTSFIPAENSALFNSSFYGHFEKLYNATPAFLKFECIDQAKFSACIHHLDTCEENKYQSIGLKTIAFEKLITNKSLTPTYMGIMDLTNSFNIDYRYMSFEKLNPSDFGNQLLKHLKEGGIFFKLKIDEEEMKNVVDSFVSEMFDNRINDFRIYYEQQGWSNWFYNNGWDATYLIFDQAMGEFYLLAKTDGS